MTKVNKSISSKCGRERESKRLRRFIRILLYFFLFAAFFFTVHSSVYADTHYVNSDSTVLNGNHNTRPFDDPSYSADDSSQTLSAAYTAASAGDIIELSGGNSGKSYSGITAAIAKANLTIQGSTISGYNGTVTITNNASNYTMGINVTGITLKNLTISGSGLNSTRPILIYKSGLTLQNIVLENAGSGVYNIDVNAGLTGTNTFNFYNVKIRGSSLTSGGFVNNVANQTFNYYNCVFDLATGNAVVLSNGIVNMFNCSIRDGGGNVVYMAGSGTVNFTNSILTIDPNLGKFGGSTNRMFYFNSGVGTVTTNNSLIQGPYMDPHTISNDDALWTSTADIINGFPYYARTTANIGFIGLSTDDIDNLDYFKTNADYAMNTYGIPLTFYVNGTNTLTQDQKDNILYLYQHGHEIGTHTRHHNGLSYTAPFSVTYSGAGASMAFVVSSNGTSLSVTGTADTHGPIDLTNSSYDTIKELVNLINTWPNYSAVRTTGDGGAIIQDSTTSISLKDTTTSLPTNVATAIPFDDDTGPNNRYYKEEITNSISDLEAIIGTGNVKTLSFPYTVANSTVLTWIRANVPKIIGVRANDSTLTSGTKYYLGNIDIYNAQIRPGTDSLKGVNYSSLSLADQKDRIEKAARVMATFTSNGYFGGFLFHSTGDLTAQEFQWFIDELAKYKTAYNLRIGSFASLFNEIRTSSNWTDSGNGIWTRTFAGTADFRLISSSPAINTGITVSGITSDILGNPLVGTPDMGAYEFQTPTAPTSLAQYKSDGTTGISSSGWTNETSAVFKFSMSSTNTYDSLTPQVEIRENGTAFTNATTNSGDAVAYSGSSVVGTVTVTGLTSGTTYHWQARVINAAGTGSWVAMGGSPDFGVDTSVPSGSSSPGYSNPPIPGINGFKCVINNNDTKTTSREVTLTLEAGSNVKYYSVSENSNLSGAGYESFAPEIYSKPFTLSLGDGLKKVYAQFMTAYNRLSDIVSDEIVLDTSSPAKQEDQPKPEDQTKPNENTQNAVIVDCDLIRATNTFDVYIVKLTNNKKFKRLILNPDIFNQYKHLKWENVKEVSQEIIDQYATSDLVRALEDTKVYKLYPNGDIGEKRWIKTLEDFLSFGYDWDAVYMINKYERDSYKTGLDISSSQQ